MPPTAVATATPTATADSASAMNAASLPAPSAAAGKASVPSQPPHGDAALAGTVSALRNTLRHWVADGMLPPLEGLTIWDIGCGWGHFALAMLEEGAARVVATDIVFDRGQIPSALSEHPRATLLEGRVEQLAESIYRGDHGAPPDVLFMHLMTEHVANLPAFFDALRVGLPSTTRVFVHHDNYYQPTGHHDHLFLALEPRSYTIQSKCVPCWSLPERCAASEGHRRSLVAWQWGPASQATVGGDCEQCNYKLRAEPWAHLVHQRRFRDIWPEPMFREAMNKVTTFQVRQYLLEAGFDILEERRSWVGNQPPAALAAQFTAQELRTFTISFLAVADCADRAPSASADTSYRRY